MIEARAGSEMEEIKAEDVERATSKMKKGKATGADDIPVIIHVTDVCHRGP